MDGSLNDPNRASGFRPAAASETALPQERTPHARGEPRPTLDFAAATSALGGRAALLYELLGILVQDVPERLRAARDACQRGDIKALRQIAHSMKGSAATVRAWRLHDLARELESAGQGVSPERCAALLCGLEAEVKNIIAAVGEHQWPE